MLESVRDLEVVLHAVATVSGPSHGCSSLLMSLAASQALAEFGVKAEQVNVRLVLMNGAATRQMLQGGQQEQGAYVTALGLSGKNRHVALRVDDWLLDLGVVESSQPEANLTPGPIIARMSHNFWCGQSASMLAGDDGSTIWAWLWSQRGRWQPDPHIDPDQVRKLAEAMANSIRICRSAAR